MKVKFNPYDKVKISVGILDTIICGGIIVLAALLIMQMI